MTVCLTHESLNGLQFCAETLGTVLSIPDGCSLFEKVVSKEVPLLQGFGEQSFGLFVEGDLLSDLFEKPSKRLCLYMLLVLVKLF